MNVRILPNLEKWGHCFFLKMTTSSFYPAAWFPAAAVQFPVSTGHIRQFCTGESFWSAGPWRQCLPGSAGRGRRFCCCSVWSAGLWSSPCRSGPWAVVDLAQADVHVLGELALVDFRVVVQLFEDFVVVFLHGWEQRGWRWKNGRLPPFGCKGNLPHGVLFSGWT